MPRRFAPILKMAASHHGGEKAALEKSRNTQAVADLSSVPSDRLLSVMTRCVFNAGFNWKVIEAKWEGFEAAFEGFDPARLAFFGDEMMDRLIADGRIVRNGQKIRAALENARFVAEVDAKEGGFGRLLAGWPADNQTGLLELLNKRGARLGGATGQYFLRFAGWDAWIASSHVCAALVREGVLDKPAATSKRDLASLQAAVNDYHADSGLPRAQISRLLAMSVG